MESAIVCRICLIMDVKMNAINTSPWDTYFESLSGINVLNTTDLPPFICFECSNMMKIFHEFKEKYLLAQSVLYGILHTNGKITPDSIQQIDREQLNLTSVKTCLPSDIQTDDYKVKIETVQDELEEKYEGNDDNDLNGYDAMSSDDEPLSLHRERKKSTQSSQAKNEPDVKDMENMETETVTTAPTAEPPKRKRGRPRKDEAAKPKKTPRAKCPDDEADIEEYCNVVELTLEQQMEEVNKRQTSSNYLNSAFQCRVCYKGFVEEHTWQHHMDKHSASYGELECPVCRFRFKTKRALQKHTTNHKKNYNCKSCTYVSKTASQAKQHQRWHKGVTYKCQHCDEISLKWTSYLSHVRNKHPSRHVCSACGYSFVSQLGLHMHRTMMHKDLPEKQSEDSEASLFCKECDLKFVSEEAYKRHMVHSDKHTKGKVFKSGCRDCGATFANAEELRLHHRREHPKRRRNAHNKKPSHLTWPATCPHCSEVIPNGREYWVHFRRMHPFESYPIRRDHVCDICGKSFRGNAFLVYHKRTHFSERAYKCDVCPKAFYNRNNLILHEKTHSERRPYPCSVCFKAFKTKNAMDRHFRCHTGEKPYSCEVCGKSFGQSNTRNLHVRAVHLRLPAPPRTRHPPQTGY